MIPTYVPPTLPVLFDAPTVPLALPRLHWGWRAYTAFVVLVGAVAGGAVGWWLAGTGQVGL